MDLLEALGFNYEELNKEEKKYYEQWLEAMSSRTITLDDVRYYIRAMKDSIANEISTYEKNDRKDLMMKGRLKNYVLLEAFLDAPEKAKRALQNQLKGMNH